MQTPIPTIRQISAGVIVLKSEAGKTAILLLEQNNKRYNRTGRSANKKVIDIGPNGKVEQGERILDAAKRELLQETNLDLKIERGFRESYNYHFDVIADSGKFKGRKVHVFKTRIYFLAKASEKDLSRLKLSDEHITSEFVTIEEALRLKSLMKPQRIFLKRLKERLSYKQTIPVN